MIQGCRRGDRAAQRALYEHTSPRIYRLLVRMLRNTEDAADLMQDTYVRVFERIGQYKATAGPATRGYPIAGNEALPFLRKPQRRQRFST